MLPALRDYDITALQAASDSHSWPYALLQRPFVPFEDALLTDDWGLAEWQQYRTWAVTRATGRIALVLFGIKELPSSLPSCPWCAAPDASIKHLLFYCLKPDQKGSFYFLVERTGILSGSNCCWAPRARFQWQAGFAGAVHIFNH